MNSVTIRWALLAAFAILAATAPTYAQLPSASAAALGMGDNFTAVARGSDAPAWNPAGLGMQGSSLVTFSLFTPRAIGGLDPVSLSDLKDHEGSSVPFSVREDWLDMITREGNEQGSGGVELTFLSASVSRVGVQLSTTGRAVANLDPGVAELLLFGNAGRTGVPVEIDLSGSSLDAVVTSTLAISYGHPIIRTPNRSLALGATLKYTFGHLMFTGVETGGSVSADPLGVQLQFPMVVSDTVLVFDKLDNGGGVGLDLGVMYETGAWNGGAVVRNLFNTFEWDQQSLFFRPGEAVFNQTERSSNFTPQPFSEAPEALRERVESFVGSPELAAGVGFRPNGRVLVTADAFHRLEDSRLGEAGSRLGAGVEFRARRWLPLRAGGAVLDNGTLASLGLGLEFGVVNFTASLARRDTDLGSDRMAMFTFSSLRARD